MNDNILPIVLDVFYILQKINVEKNQITQRIYSYIDIPENVKKITMCSSLQLFTR